MQRVNWENEKYDIAGILSFEVEEIRD